VGRSIVEKHPEGSIELRGRRQTRGGNWLVSAKYLRMVAPALSTCDFEGQATALVKVLLLGRGPRRPRPPVSARALRPPATKRRNHSIEIGYEG